MSTAGAAIVGGEAASGRPAPAASAAAGRRYLRAEGGVRSHVRRGGVVATEGLPRGDAGCRPGTRGGPVRRAEAGVPSGESIMPKINVPGSGHGKFTSAAGNRYWEYDDDKALNTLKRAF